MESDESTLTGMLALVCGVIEPDSDEAKSVLALEGDERAAELKTVSRFKTFTDDRVEEVALHAIDRRGLRRTMMADFPDDVKVAAGLLGKRLNDYMRLQRPRSTTMTYEESLQAMRSPDQVLSILDGLPVDDQDAILKLLETCGWDPNEVGIDHVDVLSYCRTIFEQAAERDAERAERNASV